MSNGSPPLFDPDFYRGIAHRGLFGEGRTENGLKAFEAALDEGFAFELDIHLTLDAQLVVCHDADLKRTTGREGWIEKMTIHDIQNGYRLLDGSPVPTLAEVLALNGERRLILAEIKTVDRNNLALAQAVKAALNSIENPKKIALISFDPLVLWRLRKTPFPRGLIVSSRRRWGRVYRQAFDFLAIEKTLLREPWVRRYARRCPLDVWAIDKEKELTDFMSLAEGLTFQHLDPTAVRSILKNRGPQPPL